MTTHTERPTIDYRTHAAEGRAFVQRVRSEDWATYAADTFVANIRAAIFYEAVILAKELTTRGVELFPDNARLQRSWRVLVAPARVRITPQQGTPPTMRRESMQWIAAHTEEYKGKWVAVRHGLLLGASLTLKALVETYPHIIGDTSTIVTKVL